MIFNDFVLSVSALKVTTLEGQPQVKTLKTEDTKICIAKNCICSKFEPVAFGISVHKKEQNIFSISIIKAFRIGFISFNSSHSLINLKLKVM